MNRNELLKMVALGEDSRRQFTKVPDRFYSSEKQQACIRNFPPWAGINQIPLPRREGRGEGVGIGTANGYE
jgi:hypothetical protein